MSKSSLHNLFRKETVIKSYLPQLAMYSRVNLETYLRKYASVFIKPNGGARGVGVIKVWKAKNQYAYVIEKGKPIYCNTIAEIDQRLNLGAKSTHVIQQGIQLAKVNGRPFDIRLMMMRNQKGQWTYVGMLAKVAGKQSIITNVLRGKGYVLDIDTALNKSLGISGERLRTIKQEIINLGHQCNLAYNKYSYDWQIGYDIGVDQKGKVWFIESNPRYPSHTLFDKLPDKTIYRKIKQLATFHRNKKKLAKDNPVLIPLIRQQHKI